MEETTEKTWIVCVLCDDIITPNHYGWAGGNNAEPLAEGRCCDNCNWDVIAARLKELE